MNLLLLSGNICHHYGLWLAGKPNYNPVRLGHSSIDTDPTELGHFSINTDLAVLREPQNTDTDL